MTPEQQFQSITSHLNPAQVDAELASKVSETLKIGTKDGKITDLVFEVMSKHVEIRLRKIYEQFTDETLAKGANYGQRLIDAMKEVGLIQAEDGNPEPIFFFLKWCFGERNTPHHNYGEYEVETFVSYWAIGNYILLEFQARKIKLPRAIPMDIHLDPTDCKLGDAFKVTTEIRRPDDGSPVVRGKVMAEATFANKSQRKVDMNFAVLENVWQAAIAASAPSGEYSVKVFSLDPSAYFVSKNAAKGKLLPLVELTTL